MVTIKQALTNTHGVSIRRTIKDLKVGEAFQWFAPDQNSFPFRKGWCVRVETVPYLSITGDKHPYFWMRLEGEAAGLISSDTGEAEIHQP
jgi:hypothetical protein